MSLKLSSSIDRPLVSSDVTSERHLMLQLQAPSGSVTRGPINLALVLDSSGSMHGDKLSRVREAAGLVVRHLTSADRLAIVTYNDTVTVIAPSAHLTPQTKVDLLQHLNRIEARGMTNLSGGWLTGVQQVAQQQTDDGQTHRVLLLTDGLANVGITRLEELVEHARQIRTRGIVTSTMGVGVDFNEELLEAMARNGGGRFQYVESARHILDCIGGDLGEMLQVSARNVAVEVALPEDINCTECLNEYATERTKHGIRVFVGDILAGDTRRVVLKLSVQPIASGEVKRIQSLALYTDTDTGRGTETAFPEIEIRQAGRSEVDTQRTNDEVAREVARLMAARAREEAVRASRTGNDDQAAAVLAAASQSLRESAYAAYPEIEAEINSLQQTRMQVRMGLSEQHRKEMHYQSYLAKQERRRYDR